MQKVSPFFFSTGDIFTTIDLLKGKTVNSSIKLQPFALTEIFSSENKWLRVLILTLENWSRAKTWTTNESNLYFRQANGSLFMDCILLNHVKKK